MDLAPGLAALLLCCADEVQPLDPLDRAPPRRDAGPLDAQVADGGADAGVDPLACASAPPLYPRLQASPTDPLEACLAVEEARCLWRHRCVEAGPIPYQVTTPGALVLLQLDDCRSSDPAANGCSAVAAAVQGGRLGIDPQAFERCIERGRAGPCERQVYGISPYDQRYQGGETLRSRFSCPWLVPRLAVGEACAHAGECLTGRCSDACPGVCLADAAPFEPCVRSDDCGPDHVCRAGICTPRRLIGEACTPVLGDGRECEDDGYCTPEGRCARRGGPGEVCSTTHFEPCAAGLVCGPEGTCVSLDGQVGETCSVERLCAEPGRCLDGRCVDTLAGGEACGRSLRGACGYGCVCEDVAGAPTCAGIRFRGEACEQPWQCARVQVCREGRCGDPPTEGQACGPSLPCGHGRCEGGVCRGFATGQRCEPVGDGLDGIHGNCQAGLNCDLPGATCQPAVACSF